MKTRCPWLTKSDSLYETYHDTEWGVPVFDDRKIFEFLVLESAQAGLSWITILRKRENYRKAFVGFDPVKVSKFRSSEVEKLLKNEGIIRNKAKIEAAINNAQCFLEVQKEFGSFAQYMWGFVGGTPIQGSITKKSDYKATTPESEAFAKDLKKRGFKFLGPTTVYAHMQAVGMVNDHSRDCFRYDEVKKLAKKI